MAEIVYDVKKTYAELDSWIAGLTPGTYNVEVDCTGVTADQFDGSNAPSAAPFGEKLKAAKEGVFFNLKPINIDPSVTNCNSLFYDCSKLTSIDTSAFTQVTEATSMFQDCSGLTSIDCSAFTQVTDAGFMFLNCSGLTSIDTSAFTQVTNASGMFQLCTGLTSIDTSGFIQVTNASGMFADCTGLTEVIWGNIKPATHTDMFSGASAAKKIGVADQETIDWIKANEANMKLTNYTAYINTFTKKYSELDAFIPTLEAGTYNLTVDCTGVGADQFDGSNVISADAAPFGEKLKKAKDGVLFNLKPINIDSAISKCLNLFYGCKSIRTIDVTEFNNITSLNMTFNRCTNLVALEGNISFSKVTDAKNAFSNCSSLKYIDISSFTNSISINNLFSNCIQLTEIIWGTLKPTEFIDTFYGTAVGKVIKVDDAETESWVNTNATAMALSDYSIEIKNNIPDVILYKDLASYSGKYGKKEYNLTIDFGDITQEDYATLESISTILNKEAESTFNLIVKVSDAITDISDLLSNSTNIKTVEFQGLQNVTNINNLCSESSSIVDITLPNLPKVETAQYAFKGTSITSMDCSVFGNLKIGKALFWNCVELKTIINPNFSSLTSALNMFMRSGITSIDLSTFTKVENISRMFSETNITEIDFKGVEAPTDMDGIFFRCNNLSVVKNIKFTHIRFPENPFENSYSLTHLENIQIDNLRNLSFSGRENLTTVKNIKFPGLRVANTLFQGCPSLTTLDLTDSLPDVSSFSDIVSDCINLTSLTLANMPKAEECIVSNVPKLSNISLSGMSPNWDISEFIEGIETSNATFNLKGSFSISPNCIFSTNSSYKFIVNNFSTRFNIEDAASAASFTNYTIEGASNEVTIDKLDRAVPLFPVGNNDITIDFDKITQEEFKALSSISSSLNNAAAGTTFNVILNGNDNITGLDNALANSTNITNFTLNKFNKLTNISSICFNSTIENIKLSNNMPSIVTAEDAFKLCNNLVDADISGLSNLILANNLFGSCANLSTVNMGVIHPAKYTGIFEGCNNLKSVRIKDPDLRDAFESYPDVPGLLPTTKITGTLKVVFSKIITGKESISVHDGEKDVVIPFTRYEEVQNEEHGIPLSKWCRNMDNVSIQGYKSYKPSCEQKYLDELSAAKMETISYPHSELLDPNLLYKIIIPYSEYSKIWDYIGANPNIIEIEISGPLKVLDPAIINSKCEHIRYIQIPASVETITSSLPWTITKLKYGGTWDNLMKNNTGVLKNIFVECIDKKGKL